MPIAGDKIYDEKEKHRKNIQLLNEILVGEKQPHQVIYKSNWFFILFFHCHHYMCSKIKSLGLLHLTLFLLFYLFIFLSVPLSLRMFSLKFVSLCYPIK